MIYYEQKIKELKDRIDKLPPEIKRRILNKLYEITGWDLLLYSPIFSEPASNMFEGMIQDIGYAKISRNLEQKIEKLESLVSCLEKSGNPSSCEMETSSWEGVLQELFSGRNIIFIILLLLFFLFSSKKGG